MTNEEIVKIWSEALKHIKSIRPAPDVHGEDTEGVRLVEETVPKTAGPHGFQSSSL